MGSKETNLQATRDSTDAVTEEKQRHRMLVALVLLLIALIVVLIKDRRFWFSSAQPAEPIATEQPASAAAPTVTPQPTPVPAVPAVQQPLAPSRAQAKPLKAKGKKHEAATLLPPEPPQTPTGPVITATNRTVLPPLEIEVVAGNQHRPLSPGNNSVKVDMESSASAAPTPSAPPTAAPASAAMVPDISSQVTVPPATAERVTHSVRPDYPLLAKQMKVQGAVVLQALIDRAGRIQELHVVTGPAILASAAQEAVKQWRFKPYYQQGQAVETEARITVNFTISTY
jgi:periplasmic protein TonB